jgi:hypothetical protein
MSVPIHAQAYACENHDLSRKCTDESAAQIVKFADGCGKEKVRCMSIDILIRCLPGNRGGDHHAKKRHIDDDDVERKRRVHQHFSAGTEVHGGAR